MRELDVREGFRLGRHDLAPELRSLEHVGLVDGAHALASLAGGFKADARDAANLALAIAHRVEAFALTGGLANTLRLAEIDVARQLAHDEDVEPRHHFRLERRRRGELRMHLRRAQVGEQAQLLAQAKDRLFGPLRALELVVARVANGAE